MVLVDSAKIAAYLGVSGVLAGRIAGRGAIAERYLRNLKGDAWYDALEALAGVDPGDGSLTRAEEAESRIAYYYELPHLITRLQDDGGMEVVSWTDTGGVKVEKRYASLGSLELLRAEVLSQAKLLIGGDVVVEYGDAESTLITSVGEASPMSGLVVTALVNE